MLAGALMFIPGVIFTVFALYQIVTPINNYIAIGMPWDYSINDLVIELLLNVTLFIPALIMFVAAYLQAEANHLGFKTCFALSIGFLCGLIFNLTDPTLLIICMIFSILATIVGFEVSKKNKQKGYSPIVVEKIAILCLRLAGIITVVILAGLISYVAIRGAQFLSWDFITADALGFKDIADRVVNPELGSIGGIRIYIVGSLIIVGYCEAIAIPLGIGAAIYLAEYAPKNKFVDTLRFFIETLAGAPSIIIGLFGLTYFVHMAGMGMSTAAGGLALAIMTLPWNIRTAEEAIRAVPQAYREAAYALGATKWQTIKKTVLLAASPGVITGIVLGFGAAIGETAVLVCTAGGVGTYRLPDQISLIGMMGKPSTVGQEMPFLTSWITGAYNRLSFAPYNPGYNSTGWQMANVMYSGALVLLIIFFVISFSALILRNYLAKKTRGAT
jgi:phosphate transport system permease protein